ncbi:MAG: RNA methyltransferase [Termitinemataceae bacterium]|nr:MAG: RNA methyltransferase [Termitinemataceae bacterium]
MNSMTETKSLLDNIVIILSRPQESGNVGAVCRAMKNFCLKHLRIVRTFDADGCLLNQLDDEKIKIRSVHAADIWENADIFDSLKDAITDCSLVIGTSRRRGHLRKNITVSPKEAASIIRERLLQTYAIHGQNTPCADGIKPYGSNKPIALVFGNERTGLEKSELDLCNIASLICANDEFPSLNLSHSVQIYCYELFLHLSDVAKNSPIGKWQPLEYGELVNLSSDICEMLKSIGFYKIGGREDQQRFFTDIFARAGITSSEAKAILKLFSKSIRLGNQNII